MAPGGGFTITGVGDVGAGELLATTGADVVGDGECFGEGEWLGVGATFGGVLVGAPSGVATSAVGVNVAELADAAEADWAATCWLMTPCGVTRP